jgi:hypothetical protein
MAYEVHVVRTRNWLDASCAPITKHDVDSLIAGDPELSWSTADYVDMGDETGTLTRYWMIAWRDQPCFWWYRDQITCSDPDDAQLSKLLHMAQALDALVVGDDGETYGADDRPSHPPTSLGVRIARWLASWRLHRQPIVASSPLPFGAGDRVRDAWGNEHIVLSIEPQAEHGLGVIRTRRSDGSEHAHAIIAHGLELITN